ncbi:MAG: AbrB/MazE/SpoVT family DNA-binding domain-containing protein [Desulfurococcales archaeon]|nr:AbrB/MazE/SpoVT family DNA-binding domain-containing protein [Desulfurococcales archaeon]
MPGRKTSLVPERRLRVGKKRALYLPRDIMEAIGLREGDPVIVRVEGERIIIERAPDPFLMAATRKKWAVVSVQEFEEDSESEQEEWSI